MSYLKAVQKPAGKLAVKGLSTRALILGAMLVLSGCSIVGGSGPKAPKSGELPVGDQGGVRKVGNPYKIAGTWYYPKEDPNYDETGFASWYGPDFHGKSTANGEVYNMNALTAAHRTLPLPSFVKVTNLENGRTVVLRVNDRGPFAKGRIIDISRRGAQLLGFERQGVTRVRVQISDEYGRVKPADKAPVLASAPVPVPVQDFEQSALPEPQAVGSAAPAAADAHFVQLGSFSSKENAEEQASRARSNGETAEVVRADTPRGTFWRVRVGPFSTRSHAESALDKLVAVGFYEARVFSGAS